MMDNKVFIGLDKGTKEGDYDCLCATKETEKGIEVVRIICRQRGKE